MHDHHDTTRDITGSTVSAEFGNYWRQFIDPEAYVFYRLADRTRIAVPRAHRDRARRLVHDAIVYGPDRIGYVRVGDTMVPGRLTPENRRLLARAVART